MWCFLLSSVVLLGSVLLFLKTKGYEEEFLAQLNPKEYTFLFLYPMSLYLLLETGLRERMLQKEKERETLSLLYIGEETELVQILYWCKKMAMAIGIVGICAIFSIGTVVGTKSVKLLQGENVLVRKEIGEGKQKVSLKIQTDNQEEQNFTVAIGERQYTEEEAKEKIEEAKEYVKKVYLGENENAQQVWKDLVLVEKIPNSEIQISWMTDGNYVNSDGSLENAGMKEKEEQAELIATLSYGEIEEELSFSVTIVPKKQITAKDWEKAVKNAMESTMKENPSEKKVKLPKEILNQKVSYTEEEEKKTNAYLLAGILLAVVMWFVSDSNLNKKLKQHDEEMLLDYPELVNKFTLLLSAGMTVNSAWGKIATEYEKKLETGEKRRFAYEEWCMTWNEMCNGVTEMKALEHFGQRIKLLPYLKFSTLLSTNLRKGTKGLLELLEYEAVDAFEERKQMTKRLAEQAGTKLLGPMMIMLFLVLIIIMVPALMSV